MKIASAQPYATKNNLGLACLIFILSAVPATAIPFGNKPVYMEGMSDCGDWLSSRQEKTSIALQDFAIGMLNGMAVGSDTEFWHADGRGISRDAVYFWIDGYCHAHPTDLLESAVISLFRQRTGMSDLAR